MSHYTRPDAKAAACTGIHHRTCGRFNLWVAENWVLIALHKITSPYLLQILQRFKERVSVDPPQKTSSRGQGSAFAKLASGRRSRSAVAGCTFVVNHSAREPTTVSYAP